MTAKVVFLVLCGLVAVYVGIRFALARRVAIVDEGGFKALAWVEGWPAVVLGCSVALGGIYLIAGAVDLVPLTRAG